jgi:hypothetical protein
VAAIIVAAFLLRTVLVLALERVAPGAAACVDRWWVWAPLAVVLIGTTLWVPLLGLAATVGAIISIALDPKRALWAERDRQPGA